MSNNPCAWCALEIGARHPKGTSHGICQRHAEQLLEAAQKHAAFESLSQRLNEPISDVLLQREVWSAEDRVLRRWWRWLRTEPVPVEGKREDQTRFSVWMFLGALIFAAGFVLASWVAHWRFAP